MRNQERDAVSTADDPLVRRATRLFEFLARVQQLKTTSPRTVDVYRREGMVLWLADVPPHDAARCAGRDGDPESVDAVLTVDRVVRPAPPAPDGDLAPWLSEPLDDPDRTPELRSRISVPDPEASPVDGVEKTRQLSLDELPEIRRNFAAWLSRWQVWARQDLVDRPVRDLYGELFSTYMSVTSHPEELELVVGVGCLSWAPPGHHQVKRHLLTFPVAIRFDDDTGTLRVERVEALEPVTVELDMLDPGLTTSPHLNDVKADARRLVEHPLDREASAVLVRRLVHTLDPDSEYRDDEVAPDITPNAVAAFAPALILRKRSQRGLTEIFQTIIGQLTESGEVPDGVLPLIDPDHTPPVGEDRTDGALFTVDGDPFLPLPVNETQLRIIRQVDTKAQVLVQGPPGTGKTHTAAALLSHLLAQGKRVLVTAHTDRALKEVRDKLPAEIKPLSVAVVGTSREDMSDLKVAVERISSTAADHDPAAALAVERSCVEAIDQLRRQRALIFRELVGIRESEVRHHERPAYRGTLAKIAVAHAADAPRFSWLDEHVEVPVDSAAPLSAAEIREWHGYLVDAGLEADLPESAGRLVDLSSLPDPRGFSDLVHAEKAAADGSARHTPLKGHSAFEGVQRLTADARNQLRHRLDDVATAADELARRREAWMNDALSDVRSGRGNIWHARGAQIGGLVELAGPLVARLGVLADVSVSGDVAPLVALAGAVRKHVVDGGKIKTNPDGSPRIGALTPKVVKQAQQLFHQVRVNGLPPVTVGQLDDFLTWGEASRVLLSLDRAWPDTVPIPQEDTLHERLQWHITELDQLRRVLALGARLDEEVRLLVQAGLPRPDWNDLAGVRAYASLVDAAAAEDAWTAAVEPLRQVEQVLEESGRWSDSAPCTGRLSSAVLERDHDAYAVAHHRLERLWSVRGMVQRRDELAERLSVAAPGLRDAVEVDPFDSGWQDRLATFDLAWAWAASGAWVRSQESPDINALQAELNRIDDRIRGHVEVVAATRAWGHAVSPDRINGRAKADLAQYAQLVRRLGKGTGGYAAKRRAEIRQAMERCRPAVPVWIMPVYRIAEQLRIQPGMFDVVIVDEASQAGLESTFLQYLAPKIVVIGDDKQVSPAAVGVDQQQLRDLARQYLADDRYIASWQDPKRSLFDEAKMRFSGLLTLTEHRRCVPEIIGFSNRIAYEPDGIRLVPVRQYGADRLEPIKPVYLADGYVRGVTNKINPVEVDAIVDQVEKCVTDPRYDGLTFGVISLLGGAQAKMIEKRLLERLPRKEWLARDLRCGDAADFQGSERDVVFLSMVAAPEPGTRMGAMTMETYVQRYNVAASRAKDQMWLFHSVSLSDLGNSEDMRFQLLDYCYGVAKRADVEGASTGAVPEDVRVEPFDSLFEQRVFNRLHDRGYSVIPQFPAQGYRLDLVVVGGKSRLAVECDGDAWHGPDAYEKDLARQRDLERCGWKFFRVRESAFYVDKAAALEELWTVLEDLEIHPSGWTPEPSGVDDLVEPVVAARPEQHRPPALLEAAHPVPATPLDLPDVDEGPVQVVGEEPSVEVAPPVAASNGFLLDYDHFTGTLPTPVDASTAAVVEGLRAIVDVEGPMLGDRLHSVFVKASGGQKVGKLIAKSLNSAITVAVRQGVLVADSPLGEIGVKPRTYRLPTQPEVRPRRLGPRLLNQVPPRELAAVVSHVAERLGWDEQEALYRGALEVLGLTRLTSNVQEQFGSVLPLAKRD